MGMIWGLYRDPVGFRLGRAEKQIVSSSHK